MNANKQDAGGPMWPTDPFEALRRIEEMGGPAGYIARECIRRNGEQCRAASGSDRDYTTEERAQIVNEFYLTMLDLRGAVTEEQERRLLRAGLLLRALSRGVPEGMVLVPSEPTPEMETAHRMYGDTSDWWQAVTSAAIAAQRKEVG